MKSDFNFVEDLINKALKKGATSVDVINVISNSNSASIRKGKVESIENAEANSLGIRVFIGKKQAIISTSDLKLETIDNIIDKAIAMAEISPEDSYIGIAEQSLLATSIADLDLYDAKPQDPKWLVDAAMACEQAALSKPGITNSSGASAGFGNSNITIANSNNFIHNYRSSYHSLSVSVVAGADDEMQTDYDFCSARYASKLLSPEIIGNNAAKYALSKMHPKKLPTCKMAVIFDPRAGKSLLASLASAINGASITRGTSFLKNDLGKQIFPSNINIIDDPFILQGLASRPFDAEGLLGKKSNIIKNGVLEMWLLDLRSARKLNMPPTGHAHRSVASIPHAGPTNFYMENGSVTKQELLNSVNKAFYVTDLMGMGINQVTGDYSQGASGFYIENGQILYPVSEVTIASNLRLMFSNLIAANDLELRYSINSPTLLINEMTIAGV
jgi:PmbA protein